MPVAGAGFGYLNQEKAKAAFIVPKILPPEAAWQLDRCIGPMVTRQRLPQIWGRAAGSAGIAAIAIIYLHFFHSRGPFAVAQDAAKGAAQFVYRILVIPAAMRQN
jgi:hypothetical protein